MSVEWEETTRKADADRSEKRDEDDGKRQRAVRRWMALLQLETSKEGD